jgi:methanogenic corrinoid protein MtbC1
MESESPLEVCVGAYRGFSRANARAEAIADASDADEETRMRRLESLLRSEILPRLTSIHHPVHQKSEASQSPILASADLERFCALLIAPDVDEAAAFLNRAAERGLGFEALIENLIAPAARRLGELWHEDRCDFFDVTFGVARLQELIDLFGPSAASERESDPRALLISMSGDSHHFGLDIIASLLREAGWSVTSQHALGADEAARVVAEDWYSVVGVTVGGKPFLEEAARTVEAVRRASLNPDIAVMVGGHVFNRRPELVARVGADGTAPDGPTAVVLAKRLLLRQTAARAG